MNLSQNMGASMSSYFPDQLMPTNEKNSHQNITKVLLVAKKVYSWD